MTRPQPSSLRKKKPVVITIYYETLPMKNKSNDTTSTKRDVHSGDLFVFCPITPSSHRQTIIIYLDDNERIFKIRSNRRFKRNRFRTFNVKAKAEKFNKKKKSTYQQRYSDLLIYATDSIYYRRWPLSYKCVLYIFFVLF